MIVFLKQTHFLKDMLDTQKHSHVKSFIEFLKIVNSVLSMVE